MLAVLAASMLASCAKPDAEFVHDDATISAIVIRPATGTSSLSVSGVIDNETGEIVFTVPKEKRREIDISYVKVRANVGYDAYVTPVLTGIKDLSSPMKITVTAKMTGTSKDYTLYAQYGN